MLLIFYLNSFYSIFPSFFPSFFIYIIINILPKKITYIYFTNKIVTFYALNLYRNFN